MDNEQGGEQPNEGLVSEAAEVISGQETAVEAVAEQVGEHADGAVANAEAEVAQVDTSVLDEARGLVARLHEIADALGISQDIEFAKMHATNAIEWLESHLRAIA